LFHVFSISLLNGAEADLPSAGLADGWLLVAVGSALGLAELIDFANRTDL